MQKRSLTKAQIQEEYQLVMAAQKNRRRFGVLYERYYEQIFLFVFKRVSDEDVCGDVTSQVFLKAMTHLDRYQFKGVPFSAWLYRIAINEVNQYFRDTKNQRTISMERSQLMDMVEEVAEESSEEAVQKMLAVLQDLSPAEVQMIELRFFEKMPFKEIAALFGITENNAKVKMYRLLGKLKKLMGKRYAKV
ncbi:MAG: sigma-70 family RNA polymerase sigma factor [Bacteroidota bacterium]